MTDRLSALDVSFLYLETPTTPMHVGGVAIFDPPGTAADGSGEPFDYDALCELVARRIAAVPRYRQKIRWVPGHLANPVWIDDEDFDISYHVRRSALPRPGSPDQLRELVGRVQSRQLDRNRPLWEIYLVEGLADGHFAIITKTHQAMVDGVTTIDIGQVLLDPSPEPREVPDELWMPRPEPTDARLVVDAVAEAIARPGQVVDVDAEAGQRVDVRSVWLGEAVWDRHGTATDVRIDGQHAHEAPVRARHLDPVTVAQAGLERVARMRQHARVVLPADQLRRADKLGVDVPQLAARDEDKAFGVR